MDPKDLRKQLEDTVNTVVDERLEGKAPKAAPSKATTPLNVAKTPADVAPSAPSAGAPTQDQAPVPTEYKTYIEYEYVGEPEPGDLENLPSEEMRYTAGKGAAPAPATEGDARTNIEKIVAGERTATSRRYAPKKGFVPGANVVLTVNGSPEAVIKIRNIYQIRGSVGGEAVLLDTINNVEVRKPISDLAAAEGYNADSYAAKVYKTQLPPEGATRQLSAADREPASFTSTDPSEFSSDNQFGEARGFLGRGVPPESATSPAPEQGGLPVPPAGETPASGAPEAISELSGRALVPQEILATPEARAEGLDANGFINEGNTPLPGQIPAYDAWLAEQPEPQLAPEKMTTAPTPVEPAAEVRPGDWRRIALAARGEREPVLTDDNATKIKRAVRGFLSEPHTLYDRVYDLYLRSLDQGTGRLTRTSFRALDSLSDPAHQNRGRQAVRAIFLHYMLNFIKEANDPKVAKAREQFLSILEQAGMSPADVANATKLEAYYPNKAFEAEADNLNVVEEQIKSITTSIAELHAEGRTGVLMHPDNAQAIAWMMREIDDGSRELLDGTRKQFNPAREESYVQGAAGKAAMELLTDEDMERLQIKPGEDAHADKAKIGVTPNQVAQYRRGSVRRYALDAAGIIDPRWQDVDERGLDLQEAFQNDRHPTADTAAAISFHVTSDATSGDNRNMINEIKATKALRAYMVAQLGEQADIPGRIRGMALKEDPSLRVARGADEYADNIRLNRSIGYTRDTSTVYAMADQIRAELSSGKLVMVRMGKLGQSGVSQVAMADGSVYYLDDMFAIFSPDDAKAQELARKTGGTISEPFRIGESIKYPGGVKAGDYDSIKFDVDPVVHQAVQHTVPLLRPNGKEFRLAYVPANLAAGLTSKPVIDDNMRPSQFGPATDTLLTHVIADNGVYPEQGSLADGYVYGDAYADLGPIYSETMRDEDAVRPMSPQEERTGFEVPRAIEEQQQAGVAPQDTTQMTPDVEGAAGKFAENLGENLVTAKRNLTPDLVVKKGLTPPKPEDLPIFDVSTKSVKRYSAENVYDELLPQPKTKLPEIGTDKTWSTAKVPVEISFPEPTAREQKIVSQIKQDLFHILRYVANKSNFASATMDTKFPALSKVNADMEGISKIRTFTEGALKFLDTEGLADYEAESVYRKRALPYFRGLGVDEADIKTKLTKYPAQVPVRSSGRDGADTFLPPISKTGLAEIDQVEALAYELYKEVAREDSLVRSGKMAIGTAPETGEVNRQVATKGKIEGLRKPLYEKIQDKRLRVLVKEFIFQNLNQQDVINAATPPDFFAAERDENPTISKEEAGVKWRAYAERNADVAKNTAVDIVTESLSGDIRTRKAVTKKSISLAAGLTPKQRAAAIAKAFDYYSAHIAQDLDGDSVVKLMNTALFGDEIQTMIGKSFAETKSIQMNDAFVDSETGEVFKPKVRGDGLRVVSDAEIREIARLAGSDIQPFTEFARNNDLKFAFDQKTGDVWIVKPKSIDKTGRIRDIDIEFQPRGIYDNPPTAEQAAETMSQYGLDEMFSVRQTDDSGAWVVSAKKNGLYKGIIGTMLPDNILDNRRMRNQMIRKLLDAGIQKNFVERALARLGASGIDVAIDPATVRIESLVKGDKIGPFTYKPHLRPEYSVRITDPLYGVPQKLAEVASMQLEAEREQRLGTSPMLEAALDEGKIPSMQGQASPVTGKIEPVGFRTEGTRRLTLTPSEQVLLKRIKMNGRLGGLLAGAGILAGTGASVLYSGAKTEEQVASVALPSAAIETLGAISPTAAAAAGLGWTAVNRGDMLRALVNLVGSIGGGALGATAGAIGGPVGSFAGGFAGSTLGATVTDSIYSAITGNEGYVPPNVATAPVSPAASVPTGVTQDTAALRNKIAEDPMKKIREEFA